jgi:hypothetical protein
MNFLANLMLSDRPRGPPRSAERTARDQRQKQRQTEERAGPTKRPAAGNQTSDSLIPTLRKLYEDNATGIFPFFSFLFFCFCFFCAVSHFCLLSGADLSGKELAEVPDSLGKLTTLRVRSGTIRRR